MIQHSPFPDLEIPSTPLTPYVLERASGNPDKPAFIDGPTGRILTYGQFVTAVRTLAGGFVAAGLKPGDVVALLAPNAPEYAVAFHAVAVAGGVVTTINPAYTAGEVAHQLTDSGATRVVAAGPFLSTALAGAQGSAVREVYLIGNPPQDREPGGEIPVHPLTDLLTAAPIEQVDVDPDGVLVLPYSSGTTGGAKGVMLSHRNLVANIAQCCCGSPLRDDDVVMGVLPFFHIYGMQVVMNGGLHEGATVVTLPRFDLAQYLEAHQRYGITQSFVAPPIVQALATHPLVDSYDLSALRRVSSGAAPLAGALAREAADRLGCEVVQGYGMTELSPVSHLTPPGQFRPGSVGVPVSNTQVRIVEPMSGEDAEDGETGEIWIRGPQVMLGYLDNPTATSLTIDEDGWLHTGDLGRVDGTGHLYVIDRLKELIKVKGFQVPPAELEALLLSHPKVADAAVIGIPDVECGEIPMAFVVLTPAAQNDPDAAETEIRAHLTARAATYKQVKRFAFVPAVPKSAAGKVLRRILREQELTG